MLSIIIELQKDGNGYITPFELTKIIIPLSGCHAELIDYVNFINWYRAGEISIDSWPNCCIEANDFRIAREYLLFLANYGYVVYAEGKTREDEQYRFNPIIGDEIAEILSTPITDMSLQKVLEQIRTTDIISEVERKRIQGYRVSRPNQAKFRQEVLEACKRCVITNVTMPEVLEAAHIKPFKYKGEDILPKG